MGPSTVGRIVVKAIEREGVAHAFCVPGESYLGILDAFNDAAKLRVIATHHEEGAGFMAMATAQASGRPGVVLVTRGPGATHLSIVLHAAQQDSVPLVAIVGQVPSSQIGRESFQEMDLLAFGRVTSKASLEVRDPHRAGEVVARALYLAQAGRPGPVLVSVPEDVANASIDAPDDHSLGVVPRPGLDSTAAERAARLLVRSRSVAIVAGGGVLRSDATPALVELADTLGASVFTGFRRFDAFPNDHRYYAGNLPWLRSDLQAPLREAETVLAVGTRLGEFTSLRYDIPGPDQRLIQIDLDASSMSVIRTPDVAMIVDARAALKGLVDSIGSTQDDQVARRRRRHAARAHTAYMSASTPRSRLKRKGFVDMEAAIAVLQEALPIGTITVSDAGAFSAYLNRYFHWSEPGTFFGTASGAMGYAVPAAVGVRLSVLDRAVVAICGDGGFAMTMSEVHTAARLGLQGLVFVVLDNGTYGSIRLHQERHYPGREIAVDQGRMDVSTIARGLGASGDKVDSALGLADAVRSGLHASRPAVVHVLTSPRQLEAWAG